MQGQELESATPWSVSFILCLPALRGSGHSPPKDVVREGCNFCIPPAFFFFLMCQTNLRTNIVLFLFSSKTTKKKDGIDSWFIAAIDILG